MVAIAEWSMNLINGAHLDVLITNAGAVFNNERAESADGIEKTMALNVIASFYLINTLQV